MKKATGLCKLCGAPKDRYPNGRFKGWYCDACAESSRAAWRASRNPCGTGHGFYSGCDICAAAKTANQREAARRGAETRRRTHPHLARPVTADVFWQRSAMTMVQRAIKHGILPRLDGTIASIDCNRKATVYEHRDYSRPLDVVPTCHSCNRNRGTPKWPHSSQFDFVRIAALKAA